MEVVDDVAGVTVVGRKWKVRFSRETGEISEWAAHGEQLLVKDEGPRHSFVRAHTDNDRAGFDTMGSFVLPKWQCDLLNPFLPYSR